MIQYLLLFSQMTVLFSQFTLWPKMWLSGKLIYYKCKTIHCRNITRSSLDMINNLGSQAQCYHILVCFSPFMYSSNFADLCWFFLCNSFVSVVLYAKEECWYREEKQSKRTASSRTWSARSLTKAKGDKISVV